MDAKINKLLAKGNWRVEMLFVGAWLFIALAGTFDGYFAWRFQADFHEWEMNPWARWLAGTFGMGLLLSFKAAGIMFAAAVAAACRYLRNRLAIPMTVLVAAAYLFLSLHYASNFLTAPGGVQLAQDMIALAGR